MSGSQNFDPMKNVTESLAGRTAVLDLWPFATQETKSHPGLGAEKTIELLEDPARLDRLIGHEFRLNDRDVVQAMLSGGYPPVVLEKRGGDWLEAYRRTYLQRDIRQLSQVADIGRFDLFLTLCAGRSGTIINKAEVSRVIGVDNKTIDHWLSLLETGYQIVSLPAYHANATKRLSKRRKWVFADSGLGLHLQAIRDGKSLIGAPHFGSLFESFVIMEIRKLYGHTDLSWDAHYWRTQQGLECDLVLPVAGRLVPIEIKHTAAPGASGCAALNSFMELYRPLAETGICISMRPRVEKLGQNIYNLPLGLIVG